MMCATAFNMSNPSARSAPGSEPTQIHTAAPDGEDKKYCPPRPGQPVEPDQEPAIHLELIRALRAGERQAFQEVVHMYAPRVRRIAMRYLPSPFDQEEAVQEVFLLLYRRREQIDPVQAHALPGFILTVARRRIIDLARSRGARPEQALGDEVLDELPSDSDASERAHDAELAAILEAFAGRLKPAYRPYFHAVFVEGRDFEEAREHLGLGRLRARYLKRVLLGRLRRHLPLLEHLGRGGPR